MRARYVLMIEGLPKKSWRNQRLMDYAKSGDWELGVIIEHHKWVEAMDIRYWSWDRI